MRDPEGGVFIVNLVSWDKNLMLAGGTQSETKDHIFYPPNLTPDPKTGHIYDWTEDSFVRRFKNGKVYESMMPLDQYKEMTEDDLRSIYRYLRKIPAIENNLGPHVQDKP